MYLELFHGRKAPDVQLDDWGTQGPVFGPLQFVHTTYATNVKFTFADGSDRDGWLQIIDDLIYYDGTYYGDWSSFATLTPEVDKRLVEFAQQKADVPKSTEPPTNQSPDDNLANVLTALNGFVQLARDYNNDTAKRDYYLQLAVETADRAAKLYRQYFILRLHGGIEPELIGPYPTSGDRDAAAQALRAENDVDLILSLDGPGSSVHIDAYSAGFFQRGITN